MTRTTLDPALLDIRIPQVGFRCILLIAYLLLTRIGHIEAAKLNIPVGGVPLFLTDLILGLLLVLTSVRSLHWPFNWACHHPAGRLVTVLIVCILIMALMRFGLSAGQSLLSAAHDCAIFAYILFLPLTVKALGAPRHAAFLLRLMIYSGVILAAMLLIDYAGGGFTGLYATSLRTTSAGSISGVGGGDVGGMLAFTLVGLTALAIASARRRMVHLFFIVLCLPALALGQTRAGFVGISLACMYMLFVYRRSLRMMVLVFVLVAFVGVLLLSDAGDFLPMGDQFAKLRMALVSALAPGDDANASWRLLRWASTLMIWQGSPIFGVGFVTPIVDPMLVPPSEAEGSGFNQGMPHNTYLMVLARMGIVGLLLLLFLHGVIAWHLHKRLMREQHARHRVDPDRLAAGAMLFAMSGYAFFVLFFERPMHNAAYWIMLGIAMCLSEKSQDELEIHHD